MDISGKGHITLALDEVEQRPIQTKRTWKRQWNSLSRFQRNLILTIIVAFIFTLFFLFPSHKSKASHPNKLLTAKEHFVESNHIPGENFKNHKKHESISKDSHNDWPKPEPIRPHENEIEQNDIQEKDKARDIKEMNQKMFNKLVAHADLDELNENSIMNQADDFNMKEIELAKDFKGPSPNNKRQVAVVDAFKHAWKGYKDYAWGHDNLKPITQGYHDWFGLGLTIVDALDTLYIMDLQDEFDEAKQWVEHHLKFDINKDVNLFEVTIRILGGLLSAYHLSGDKMFLNKASELGNRLLPCFDSPSGIPYSDINLETMKAHAPKWSPDSSTSEVTTLQLEFRDLSYSTGNPIYEQVVSVINRKVHELEKKNGLCPIFINANTGQFREYSTISLGARGDSYYEYLLKQWIQFGKQNDDFLVEDYKTAIDGVLQWLVKRTPKENLLYIGELISGKDFKPKMDHLVCFMPGTLLLGYKNGLPDSHLTLAQDLLETCYKTYMYQPTHLSPEITYFNLNGESESDLYVKANDAHNLQRPEFVESLYYFYAITGNKTYQDMGWDVFQAFEKYTRVKHGYTSIGNVKNMLNTKPRDMMESFWLGETLKYFYLLFSDDRNEIDLSKYVFNTEAHPLPIREIM